MATEKYIPIAESALRSLLEAQHLCQALVQGGVEIYEWGDTAITQYLNELGAESIDEFVDMDVDSFEREAESLNFPVDTFFGKTEKIRLHCWGLQGEIPDKIVEIKIPDNESRYRIIEKEKKKWWDETVQWKCLHVERALEDFRVETCECLGIPHYEESAWGNLISPKIDGLRDEFITHLIGAEPVNE